MAYNQKELVEIFSMAPADALRYESLHKSRESLFEVQVGDVLLTMDSDCTINSINESIDVIRNRIHTLEEELIELTFKYNMEDIASRDTGKMK